VQPPLSRFDWERLIRELDLPSAVKCTAYALATFLDGKTGMNAHPGTPALIKATGLSKPTLLKAMQRLEKEGLIMAVTKAGKKGLPRDFATVWQVCTPVDNPAVRRLADEIRRGRLQAV
jgi:hypothetical protein